MSGQQDNATYETESPQQPLSPWHLDFLTSRTVSFRYFRITKSMGFFVDSTPEGLRQGVFATGRMKN